ncbi:hypothetical protein V2I01_14480 [Micromonospora sp. BRA006-A]|nr:hypothetical protein [Micromonospora sp. BRA006-A]
MGHERELGTGTGRGGAGTRRRGHPAFGGVGLAGQILPATEAYRTLEQGLREHPEAARKRVDRLLRKGSPAGRAYAATLLEAVDPDAGRDAWRGCAATTASSPRSPAASWAAPRWADTPPTGSPVPKVADRTLSEQDFRRRACGCYRSRRARWGRR